MKRKCISINVCIIRKCLKDSCSLEKAKASLAFFFAFPDNSFGFSSSSESSSIFTDDSKDIFFNKLNAHRRVIMNYTRMLPILSKPPRRISIEAPQAPLPGKNTVSSDSYRIKSKQIKMDKQIGDGTYSRVYVGRYQGRKVAVKKFNYEI